jgi:DNA-binding MarR family transcriptional regulator
MSGASETSAPGFLVWRLSMRWCAAVDRAVAPLGLTHAQYSVLASLLELQSAGVQPSQRELAEHAGLEAIYISKLARALERAGLVARREHPIDTRAVQLSLTPRGMDVAHRAVELIDELEEKLAAPLGGSHSARSASFVRDLEELLAGTRPAQRQPARPPPAQRQPARPPPHLSRYVPGRGSHGPGAT